MTERTAAILADPHPNTHMVYPYADSEHVVPAVAFFVVQGISRDESAVLIVTQEKRDAVESLLENQGFAPAQMEQDGRLRFLDVVECIARVLVEDVPAPKALDANLGATIRAARASAPASKVRYTEKW